MDSHVPRLPVGLVVVLALVGALVLGPSARATQPECQVVNLPPKKTTYTSNEYGYPLGIAITEAAPGDTLEVVGTCHGSFYIYMDLTLQGRPSANHADTIDGEGSTAVLTVDSTAAVTVTNLTITGGESGPGIYNYGTVTLIDSTVSGNTAFTYGGGGIYYYGYPDSLKLTNSTVSGNTPDQILTVPPP
jgi:nitrous oxidase accessory protein NosD